MFLWVQWNVKATFCSTLQESAALRSDLCFANSHVTYCFTLNRENCCMISLFENELLLWSDTVTLLLEHEWAAKLYLYSSCAGRSFHCRVATHLHVMSSENLYFQMCTNSASGGVITSSFLWFSFIIFIIIGLLSEWAHGTTCFFTIQNHKYGHQTKIKAGQGIGLCFLVNTPQTDFCTFNLVSTI